MSDEDWIEGVVDGPDTDVNDWDRYKRMTRTRRPNPFRKSRFHPPPPGLRPYTKECEKEWCDGTWQSYKRHRYYALHHGAGPACAKAKRAWAKYYDNRKNVLRSKNDTDKKQRDS